MNLTFSLQAFKYLVFSTSAGHVLYLSFLHPSVFPLIIFLQKNGGKAIQS